MEDRKILIKYKENQFEILCPNSFDELEYRFIEKINDEENKNYKFYILDDENQKIFLIN